MWKSLPEYSGATSATDAAAATVHVNLMGTIVPWAVAIVVLVIYGPINLSRRAKQAPESEERGAP